MSKKDWINISLCQYIQNWMPHKAETFQDFCYTYQKRRQIFSNFIWSLPPFWVSSDGVQFHFQKRQYHLKSLLDSTTGGCICNLEYCSSIRSYLPPWAAPTTILSLVKMCRHNFSSKDEQFSAVLQMHPIGISPVCLTIKIRKTSFHFRKSQHSIFIFFSFPNAR